jgi:hypothetical protein
MNKAPTTNETSKPTPNYWKRRAVALATASAIALGATVAIDKGIENVKTNNLVGELKEAGPKADDKFFHGDYQDKNVVGVKITGTEAASNIAASIAKEGNALQVQDVIVDELGVRPETDEVAVLPANLVRPNAPNQIQPVPNDPNTHVG